MWQQVSLHLSPTQYNAAAHPLLYKSLFLINLGNFMHGACLVIMRCYLNCLGTFQIGLYNGSRCAWE